MSNIHGLCIQSGAKKTEYLPCMKHVHLLRDQGALRGTRSMSVGELLNKIFRSPGGKEKPPRIE